MFVYIHFVGYLLVLYLFVKFCSQNIGFLKILYCLITVKVDFDLLLIYRDPNMTFRKEFPNLIAAFYMWAMA